MAPATSQNSRSRTRPHRILRGAARTSKARARDLESRIWALLEAGKTPTAIAREVGIARQSVHRIIRRVEAQYHESIMATVDDMKARQARRLWHMVDEAMAAWERSKRPATRVRKTAGRGTDTDGRKGCRGRELFEQTDTRLTTQVGDVRYLDRARAALADIRKLYGLNAPANAPGDPSQREPEGCVVTWAGEPGEKSATE